MPKPESPKIPQSEQAPAQPVSESVTESPEVVAENAKARDAATAEVRSRLEQHGQEAAGQSEATQSEEKIKTYEQSSEEARLLEKIGGAPIAHHLYTGDFNKDLGTLMHAREDHDKRVRKIAAIGMTAVGVTIFTASTAVVVATGGSALTMVGTAAVFPIVGGIGIWHGVKFLQQSIRRGMEKRAREFVA